MHECNDNDFLFLAGFARPGGLYLLSQKVRANPTKKKELQINMSNIIAKTWYVMIVYMLCMHMRQFMNHSCSTPNWFVVRKPWPQSVSILDHVWSCLTLKFKCIFSRSQNASWNWNTHIHVWMTLQAYAKSMVWSSSSRTWSQQLPDPRGIHYRSSRFDAGETGRYVLEWPSMKPVPKMQKKKQYLKR